ncbi:MAG: hypothetical protein ACLQVF_35900 [Isosphaeraceae bacterium]
MDTIRYPVNECLFDWEAAFGREGRYIVVRIRLVPDPLAAPPISGAELVRLKKLWRGGIETIWDNQMACGAGQENLNIFVDWVEKKEDHCVTVKRGRGRSNMLTWHDLDDGRTAAHEFGHMLGLKDEYRDPNCPHRLPVETGTIMDTLEGAGHRRHFDVICGARPAPPAPLAGVWLGGDPAAIPTPPVAGVALPMAPVETQEFTPRRFRLVISGGPPGQRLECEVEVDVDLKKTRVKFNDPLRHIESIDVERDCSPKTLADLRAVSRPGEWPYEPPRRFVPDSLVASITVSSGPQSRTIHYPVEEPGPDGDVAAALTGFEADTDSWIVRRMHQVLLAEGSGILAEHEGGQAPVGSQPWEWVPRILPGGRNIVTHRQAALAQMAPQLSAAAPPATVPTPTPISRAKLEIRADDYRTRLVKYIPTEIVAVYLIIDRIIEAAPGQSTVELLSRWANFLCAFILTPVYLRFAQDVRSKLQLALSTVVFVAWAFALGGPFASIPGYNPVIGVVMMTVVTALIPFIEPEGI